MIFGASHARISQLESGMWTKPPTRKLMERVARTYGKKLWEVMEAAGFRSGLPPDVQLGVDTHELFRRMILDLDLRPAHFEDRDFSLLSPLQKQQMLDLAEQVDRLVRERGPCIELILAEDSVPPNNPRRPPYEN